MKIAMVSMNAGPLAGLGEVDAGGRRVVVDCLSDALARLGHEVTVYTQRDDNALPDCLTTAAGVHVHHLRTGRLPASDPSAAQAAIARFGSGLRDEWGVDRPDVVHAHAWMSGKAASPPARELGIPLVQTFHGLARTATSRRAMSAETAQRAVEEAQLLPECSRVIATSSAEVFSLLGMGANPGAIKLIPSGVDLELFAPAERGGEPRRAGFVAVTLGRLVSDAGVGDVIEALQGVDGVELIVGGGRFEPGESAVDPDARALAERARELGVAERVTFAGRVARDAVAAFLRSADVVVCAPWHDSIGTVALEAMACGVPVIVSAVGALVDAVADGMTGLHVPPMAPRQIAYALGALKADPARRARFGRFGFERASARYGWSRIAAETFDVYVSVARREVPIGTTRGCVS